MADFSSYIQQDFSEVICGQLHTGDYCVYTTRSPQKETVNEDAAALIPYNHKSGILLVADGVGGERAGQEASKIAINSLAKKITQASSEDIPLRELILDGIESANKAVMDLGIGAATTLAVIELTANMARPYHVGDSMILITGQRGKVKFQTISHSPVGYAMESGLLDESDAVHHEERHIVSNVIGSPDMHIDIGPTVMLSLRDTVIIASDGLADNLYNEEIIEISRKGPLNTAADKFIALARQRMEAPKEGLPSKPDDLTFILYRPTKMK